MRGEGISPKWVGFMASIYVKLVTKFWSNLNSACLTQRLQYAAAYWVGKEVECFKTGDEGAGSKIN